LCILCRIGSCSATELIENSAFVVPSIGKLRIDLDEGIIRLKPTPKRRTGLSFSMTKPLLPLTAENKVILKSEDH
jgi:hypothetical protein